MSELRNKMVAILGRAAENKPLADPGKYHDKFKQSGVEKAITIIQELNRREVDLRDYAYLSIGGSIGAEIVHILEHTPIKFGYLLEYNSDATLIAERESERLRKKGKILKVHCGDAMREIEHCKEELLKWRTQHLVKGLVCSAQAVLHELETRSESFDLNYLLGEIIWDWSDCIFICREPCVPSDWPKEVQISIPGIESGLLEKLALDIKTKLNIEASVRRAGPKFITLPSSLAVELLFKIFYIDDYAYEIQERITAFAPNNLVSAIESTPLGPNSVSQTRGNSSSFERFYRQHNVCARRTDGKGLPIPLAFLWVFAQRPTNMLETKPLSQTPAIKTLQDQGATRILTDKRSAALSLKAANALNSQKESILNTPIVPWAPNKSPSLRFLWPGLIVDPRLIFQKHPAQSKRLSIWLKKFRWNKNIAVIGNPGSGKSTTLRYSFLRLAALYDIGHKYHPVIGHASEYIDWFRDPSNETALSLSISEAQLSKGNIIFLIDGVDEIDAALVEELFNYLQRIEESRVTFWVACRTDYFYKEISVCEKRTSLFFEILELAEWDIQQDSRPFVKAYSRRANINNLLKTFDALTQNQQAVVFLKNPFRLTLVVYLISINADTRFSFTNVFALYRDFYNHWIDRETHRKTSLLTSHAVAKLHTAIALNVFKSRRMTYVERTKGLSTYFSKALEHSAFRELLRLSKDRNIIGFHHETIGEFLIAARILRALQGSSKQIQDVLMEIYTFEINYFVRNGIALLNNEESSRLSRRLSNEYFAYATVAYSKKSRLSKIAKTAAAYSSSFSKTEPNTNLKIREQLLYYVGRVPSDVYPQVLSIAFENEKPPILRRIAALGAILHGNYDVERAYLNLLTPNSHWDVENRSIQLVYFSDVNGDFYQFKDDGRLSWSKTRSAIFSRLSSNHERDIRLRWWDMRTLRLFLISRPSSVLTPDDVSIIKSAVPTLTAMQAERLKSLRQEQADLLNCFKAKT